MTESKIEVVRALIDYQNDFQAVMEEVGAEALNPDPLIGVMQLFSLDSPAEKICGISAAEKMGLSAKEGVAYFIFLSASVAVEGERRKGFFQRLRMRFAPQPGSLMHGHVAMTNYAINVLLGGQPDQAKGMLFAEHYQREFGLYVS